MRPLFFLRVRIKQVMEGIFNKSAAFGLFQDDSVLMQHLVESFYYPGSKVRVFVQAPIRSQFGRETAVNMASQLDVGIPAIRARRAAPQAQLLKIQRLLVNGARLIRR